MRFMVLVLSGLFGLATLFYVKYEQARVMKKVDAVVASHSDTGQLSKPEIKPEDLPLARTVLAETTQQRRGRTIHKRYVAFGAWLTECVHSYGSGRVEPTIWCDVYPWDGSQPSRPLAILPFKDRATVQFYNDKPPKLVLHTSKRAPATLLRYRCGSALWQGPENAGRLKFFYDQDAWPFIAQMRSTDCTISYTPAGADKTVTINQSFHGFAVAYDYAKLFMLAPPRG